MDGDPYRILGISRDASEADLRAAYLRCARACHPDLHGGDARTAQQFREVVAAYQAIRADRVRPPAAPRARSRLVDGIIVTLLWLVAALLLLTLI